MDPLRDAFFFSCHMNCAADHPGLESSFSLWAPGSFSLQMRQAALQNVKFIKNFFAGRTSWNVSMPLR